MSNMITRRLVGNFAIVLHGIEAPTDVEWAEYMSVVKQIPLEHLHKIVITPGGGPTAKHRKSFNDYLAGRHFRAAIVSPSAGTRAIITLMSWFNKELKGFAPHQFREAMNFARLSAAEATRLWPEITDLAKQISSPALDALVERLGAQLESVRVAS